MDMVKFAAIVMGKVHEYVQPALDGVLATLKASEAALAARIEAIPAGKDGRDGIDGAAGIPGADGKDGRDGVDGKDGAPGVDGLPGAAGRDGIDGQPGEPGQNGKDGAAGLDGKDGAPGAEVSDERLVAAVHGVLTAYMKANPPAPGRDGRDGVPGTAGRDGDAGKDGADGRDGLGFDDLSAEFDGERTVMLKFTRGDLVKAFPLKLPIPIPRGVFNEERAYEFNDTVTYAGAQWRAVKDHPEGRPAHSSDWVLMVKRGEPGKSVAQVAVKPPETFRLGNGAHS